MKRILALLLVLAMAFGLFAGCGKQTPDVTTEPTQTTTVETQPDTQLEKAIEYLRAFYKNVAEKTPMDYTRLGTVRIGITPYEVVWSVDVTEDVLKIVKNEDGTYTIDINEEAIKESTEPTPYVLTATITGKDGRQLSISWNHVVPAAIDEEALDVIKKAYQLADGETMEGTFTVTGVIKTIDTLYDPSYKNVTVTIEVPGAEDMPIKCYRLKGDGADKLAVGDTITVTGSFTNYKGVVQFAQGCILEAVESGGAAAPVAPEDPKQILREAYALAPGASLPYYCYLTGTITFVDQAYDPNYSNVTVTISTNGYTIKCYRMKGDGADQLNINDIITVGGVITNYNGTIEFGAGCSLTNLVNKEPPAAIADPTPGSTVSVSDAYAIGRGKDHDTYTEGKYYVTGKIVSIENDYYGNLHIADGNGNKLMIYGSYSEDGKTRFGELSNKPSVGDTITVYGAIGRYGSNPQIKNAWIIGAKGAAPEIPDAPTVEQVTEIKAGTPYRFGMAQGNLENAVYYLAGGMNGFYMETTADPAAAINVYVEETAGGYYFYTLSGETKLYINMVVSADGEHVNGAYEATASTVYTYDAAKNTLTATVGGAEYWFGTRNDKTYTTMGPCAVEYAGFFGEFYVGSEETPEDPEQPEEPELSEIAADKAYKFGMAQGNLDNKVFYLKGGMDGYYMATTDDVTAAIDVYVEVTEGGYYFYTKNGDEKLYINMVVNGTHVNGAYEATASTVYTYNAEKNTLIAIVNDAEYWFSTRNDNTYTTMGPNKVSYNGFFGQFIDLNAEPEQPDVPDVPDEPEDPESSEITADKAYKFGMAQGNLDNKVFYLKGGMDGYYMATTDDVTAAIDVYVEVTEGGYYFYTKSGETKQYINMVVNGTHVNGAYEATASTVYTYNAEKNTLIAIVNDAEYWFSTRNDNTYTTMGPNKVSYNGFFGQFIDLNAEPECKHTNTTVEGKIDATCTVDGYTGDTKCADCGETIATGEVITAAGHSFVNGTCGVCGEADPNYTPDVPAEPTVATSLTAGTAYKLGLFSTSKNATYYFIGTMSGYYGATETAYETAVDVFVEEVAGGYHLYFLNASGAKQYINLEASGTHRNFVFGATAKSVFTWDAEKNALYTTVEGEICYMGTYGNYVTVGVLQTAKLKDSDYIARLYTMGSSEPEVPACQHTNTTVEGKIDATCTVDGYTGDTKCADCGVTIATGEVITAAGHSFVNGTCGVCGEADPNYTPDVPAEPTVATSLTAGTAYKLGLFSTSKNATYYFIGTMSGYYGATETAYETAVDVFVEEVAGGYHLYFLNASGAKQYINLEASGTHRNFVFGATAKSVFTWDAEKNALYTTVEGEICYMGTYGNYVTVGVLQTAKLKDSDYIARLYTMGSSEPEVPACQHTNTKVEGKVEATCTTAGFTGNTVCADCGVTITEGKEIAAFGHTTKVEGKVDATCTEAGHTGKTVCETCGMTTDAGDVIPAIGHNFVDGTCGVCGEADPNYTPDVPAEPTVATSLTAGTAYKLGLFSTSKNATYYFIGTMSGYYGATETAYETAIDVFVEEVEDGYHLYFLNASGAKQYINLEASGTHRNFVFGATAKSVFTWDAEKNALYTTVEGEICYMGTYGNYVTVGVLQTAKLKDSDYIARLYTLGSSEPEDPTYEHVIENGGGYAASLSEDGTQLDCFQFGNEGAIFYTNYFTEKPAEGYYELREYNGKFYYTSAPSWGVIPYESITISGKTAQLKMYDDEAMVELELIAENQYKIITGNGNLPAGLVFTFGAEYCEVLGHLGVRNCEEDVKCTRCETVICGPTGHEYGEDGVCFRCFSAMRPEEPAAPAGDKADFNTIVTPDAFGDSKYTNTYTTDNGWTVVNSAIQTGKAAEPEANPQFPVIGPDNTHKAVCLNGKTSAPGSITSPTLTGGISKLTLKYTKMFTDTKLSVTITVTDLATGTTYTHTVARDVAKIDDKFVVWNDEWVLETPITGDFTIVVVNDCPSGSTSNKDRMTILELAWEGAVAAHEHSYTVTSTATCTADGEATYTCECGDTYTEAAPKLGHIDENLDVECDREGCTSKVAPAANSKLSTFTANCLGSKLSTDYQYYVEGTIVEVLDAKNGIFLIDDGTGETFYFRLPKNADGVSHASWAIKLTLGDKVSVYGKVNKYTTSTAPNGQFWPAIQGGVVTVLEQHPHDFTFSPATCSAPAYCACGQSHGEPLGCADNNGDDLCDDCGKNVKLVYEYIAIRTDNNSGVLDTAAGTYTWGNTNFDVQVVKGTSSQLYSTAKDHMRVYNGNQFVLANKNGLAVKTITVYLTNATQVGNLEKYLTGYTYTKDTENFTVTIEVNSTANLTLSITATTQIKGVEFGYEK